MVEMLLFISFFVFFLSYLFSVSSTFSEGTGWVECLKDFLNEEEVALFDLCLFLFLFFAMSVIY